MGRRLAFASLPSWRRFARLERDQRALRVEAFARLVAVWLQLRLRPFEKAIASEAVPLRKGKPASPSDIAQAVRWAAATAPFRAVCLHQGLAWQAMLRRRGADARLHYGLAAADGLTAHVWVTVAGKPVIGGEEAASFQPVACFPH